MKSRSLNYSEVLCEFSQCYTYKNRHFWEVQKREKQGNTTTIANFQRERARGKWKNRRKQENSWLSRALWLTRGRESKGFSRETSLDLNFNSSQISSMLSNTSLNIPRTQVSESVTRWDWNRWWWTLIGYCTCEGTKNLLAGKGRALLCQLYAIGM